ncbi:MAG: hypothetical protein ACAH95_00900 [Fimbriimonas sp.]
MRSSEPPELFNIVKLLSESGADFVIIGGLALQLQGGDYLTVDVDFAFTRKRENAKLIASALAPYRPLPLNWPEGVPYVWDDQMLMNSTVVTLETDLGRIDFLAEPDGAPPYAQLRANATIFEMYGRQVFVASIDDLIAMKRAAGRTKDLAHIAELETIKKLLEEA